MTRPYPPSRARACSAAMAGRSSSSPPARLEQEIISGHQFRATVSAATDVRRRPPAPGLDRAASQRP
jgi:hypothetical protein